MIGPGLGLLYLDETDSWERSRQALLWGNTPKSPIPRPQNLTPHKVSRCGELGDNQPTKRSMRGGERDIHCCLLVSGALPSCTHGKSHPSASSYRGLWTRSRAPKIGTFFTVLSLAAGTSRPFYRVGHQANELARGRKITETGMAAFTARFWGLWLTSFPPSPGWAINMWAPRIKKREKGADARFR
jgi:hypothetical protein